MSSLSLHTKIDTLPVSLQQQVSDYIDTLIKESEGKDKKKIVPKFGSAKGKIWMSPDFDEPLEEFKDYM